MLDKAAVSTRMRRCVRFQPIQMRLKTDPIGGIAREKIGGVQTKEKGPANRSLLKTLTRTVLRAPRK